MSTDPKGAPAQIGVLCPHCGRLSHVPSTFEGRSGRCPGCRELITAVTSAAPSPTPDSVEEESAPEPEADSAFPLPAPAVVPTTAEVPTRARKPCPICGETILQAAKKCRHCGEFLSRGARRGGRRRLSVYRLASPGRRLAAYTVDQLLLLAVPTLCGSIAASEIWIPWMVALAIAWFTAIALWQAYLVTMTGQSVGKKAVHIKILLQDGSAVDFVKGVLIRTWAVGALNVFGSVLVYFGCAFYLVDKLMILSEDRRCLHDQMAGTQVVDVDHGGVPIRSRPEGHTG